MQCARDTHIGGSTGKYPDTRTPQVRFGSLPGQHPDTYPDTRKL